MARTRRGVARAPGPGTGGRRRRFGFFLLIAGGVYLLMSAEGVAAPPTVTTTVSALAYTENAAATAVDSGLVLNEPEADPILGATVRILTNYQNGEDVLAFSDQLGIAGAWNAGTGILTLSGTTTAADYQTALRSVTYQNTSDAPSTSTRTVQIVVTDANAESGSATRDIAVTAVDDPLDVTTTGGSLAFTEGAAATVLDSALTVVDLDHNITGATVQVTGNYVNGEDVLAFTDQLGITGVWAPVSGTLTLSGTTTPANYQTALRTITYANASENPSTLPRSVTFTPTSPGNSDSGIRVVAITAVNDAPAAGGATTVTNPGGGAANVLEDSVPGAANIRLTPPTLTDVDGSAPTQVRIMTATGGTIAQGDGSVIGLGSGGSLLTLAGGVVDLRFTPTANRDTSGSFDYVVVDGSNPSVNSPSSTATVPIVPVNDVPTTTMSGGSAAFVENGSAVAVDAGATTADIDNANLASATLQITGNYASGEDVLAFTNQLGVTGSWAVGSGTMTLTGSATLADYQTAIRAVTYANGSDNPSTAVRTVTLIANDGSAPSAGTTRTVTVTAANDAPTVGTTGGSAAYTENAAAVVLDAGITTADVDSANLSGASVQITGNYATGEDVLAFTNQSGISGAWVAGSGTMNLTGSATLAQYQSALRTITYVNTSDALSTSARTVTIIVNDGADPSSGATRGIAVTAVNDAPVLAGTGGSITYTENDSPTVVDGGVTLADIDHASMSGATVAITSGYWNGEDVLTFTNQSGITGSWSAGTGTMTLSGSASVAGYQTAVRSITYANTSDAPSSTTRTVSFTVTDGVTPSNTVSRSVAVVPVNDLPATTTSSGSATYVEDAAPIVLDSALAVVDADDAALTQARVTIAGGYSTGHDALSATGAGGISAAWDAASGVLTLSGSASPATYQTVLRSVVFANDSQEPSTASRMVTITVYDPSGPGGTAGRSVAVTSVNDAPVARDDGATTVQAATVTVDVVANDSDIEGDALSVIAATSETGGSASITAGGNVTVIPEDSFVGTLDVTYTLSDGSAQATGRLAVTVAPAADIGLSLTATPSPARVGDDVDVDLVVANNGPGAALGSDIVVHATTGYLITRATTAGGRCDYSREEAICELPDVAADESALIEIQVRASATGTLSVRATAATASFDADDSDNTAAAAVRVNAAASRTTPIGPRRPTVTTSTTSTAPAPVLTTTSSSSTTSTTRPVPRTTTTTRPKATTTTLAAPADDADKPKEKEKENNSTGVAVGLMFMIMGVVGTVFILYRRRQLEM